MKLNKKLRTLFSSCAIALPLLTSTAIFSPKVNAYPLAKITNNTRSTATGRIEYLGGGGIFGCNPDNYSVAPGKQWTAKSRGGCLITKITSNLSNGKPVVTYTSTGTSYSNFLIQPTGSGYRVFSDSEYDRYTDNKIDGGPGFYIVNKTDWPLAISLNQVGCLYHDVVGKGDVFKRDTGAVWFTIKVNIQPDGQTKSDWDCIQPVAEVVGNVLISAVTGGAGTALSVGRASTITIAKGAVRETIDPLSQFAAKQIGQLITDNGELELKGQYAGYPWPFQCDKMPEYHITGGPSLNIVNGEAVIGQGKKFTMTKVNSCGDDMMMASSKSASADPKIQSNQKLIDESASHGAIPKPIPIVKSILGNYENHLYDRGGKNDWHYVTVSQIDETTLEWRNRAGVAWRLKTTPNKEILNVERDSPYFSQGHTSVKVVWDGDRVSGLIGPGNELYEKSR